MKIHLLLISTNGILAFDAFISHVPNGNFGLDQGIKALGHVNRLGSGSLNEFGKAFKENGKKWNVDLCLLDSDGDGQYNGWELGDVCCQWEPNNPMPPIPEGRPLSHPGEKDSVSGAQLSPKFQLQTVRDAVKSLSSSQQRNEVFEQHGVICPELQKDAKESLESAPMWTWVFSPFHAKHAFTVVVVVGYLYLAAISEFGFKSLARESYKHKLLTMMECFVWVEGISVLLHIWADNEAFVDLPFFGELAVSFIRHHDIPDIIVKQSWLVFLAGVDAGVQLLVVAACIFRSPAMTHFTLLAVPLLYLMMASHRWTHCHPDDVPAIVTVLQDVGILLQPVAHNVHHAGEHEMNFALLSGWSNTFVNFITKHFLGPKNTIWFPIFLLWACLPGLMGLKQTNRVFHKFYTLKDPVKVESGLFVEAKEV